MKTIADMLTGMSILIVAASMIGGSPTPKKVSPSPIKTVFLPKTTNLPEEIPTPEVPYERTQPPQDVQCTPDRYAIMQYWQADLTRARHLSRICSPSQTKQIFGATYRPLMIAIQEGAVNRSKTPQPPEDYAQIIIARHNLGGCSNGKCTTAGNGFVPLSSEK